MTKSHEPDPLAFPVFALQAGETRFSLDTLELLRCLRAAADEAYVVPPLPAGWWDTLPAHLVGESVGITDQATTLTNRATVEALVEASCDYAGIHVFLEVLVGQEIIPIDFSTFLTCLRLTEAHGGFPPLQEEWWLSVAQRYDIWTEIHGPEKRCPCMDTSSERTYPL
ncbi:hypothetical protein [Rhodospirillum sp. A1_3_36]|uniref:hypothetical protein n=1 Tax=Rhodospirillum sp. A1_3_36 TaxID=3391666 RepID=UPI0039A7585E